MLHVLVVVVSLTPPFCASCFTLHPRNYVVPLVLDSHSLSFPVSNSSHTCRAVCRVCSLPPTIPNYSTMYRLFSLLSCFPLASAGLSRPPSGWVCKSAPALQIHQLANALSCDHPSTALSLILQTVQHKYLCSVYTACSPINICCVKALYTRNARYTIWHCQNAECCYELRACNRAQMQYSIRSFS
jgi:hypothetical protein